MLLGSICGLFTIMLLVVAVAADVVVQVICRRRRIWDCRRPPPSLHPVVVAVRRT